MNRIEMEVLVKMAHERTRKLAARDQQPVEARPLIVDRPSDFRPLNRLHKRLSR